MRAILLAAGRGRRLGVNEPKCLLDIAGSSLLERHLDNMVAAGIDEVTIVMGHLHEMLSGALNTIVARRRDAGRPLALAVETILNERYEHGSLVSLACAAHHLAAEGGIWMDADVLYPAAMLRRLVDSQHPACALLDGRSSEQGEEMMLGAREGRILRIGRRVGDGWDKVGESVGFFKVDVASGTSLKRILDAELKAQRLDQEHEDGLNKMLAEEVFGYELVDDLPWTEIDFQEDIEKASQLAASIGQPAVTSPQRPHGSAAQ